MVYTPIDVVKERLQVQRIMGPGYEYAGSTRNVIRTTLNERGLAGLMRGYWLTNCVWLPWNIMYITFYEATKRWWASTLEVGQVRDLPGWSIAVSSCTSAAVAAVATHPLDVIKTRVQVLASGHGVSGSTTAWQVARALVLTEGAQALWSGLTARVLHIAPGATLSWAVYETLQSMG